MRTHYQRLGVAPHASHDEIRRAYRVLAQQHHPDVAPDTTTTMAEINAAWEVLGDPEKRRTYDLAIGVTPRPQFWIGAGRDGEDDEDGDPLAHLQDDPNAPPRRSRPSDLLVAIPVVLLLVAVATFAFSTLSQNAGLRTASILLAPVTAGSFFAAPLFMMLRSRARDRD